MTYSDWIDKVPPGIKSDSVWKIEAYRLALFLGDLAWHDQIKILSDRRTASLASQFYPAIGSISANLAEGYSRSSKRDQARFFEYALGSARESRDWYYKTRHVLGEEITRHRFKLLCSILRLLLVTVPRQRREAVEASRNSRRVQEAAPEYGQMADSALELAELKAEDVPLSSDCSSRDTRHETRYTQRKSALFSR